MNRSFLNLSLLFVGIIFFSSCEKSQSPRTYCEITDDSGYNPVTTNDQSDPHAGLDLGPNAQTQQMPNGDPHAGFTKEQLAQMLGSAQMTNSTESPVVWTLPQGWQQKPATGMRIASFTSKTEDSAFDCSIVALAGAAGGLEPNIIRWLGQINIVVPPENELKNFIDKQEKVSLDKNLSALLVDFTSLQKKSDQSTPSMLAAVIETPAQRIFVKLTGSKQKVLEQAKNFKIFVQSLKFKE